MFPLVETGLGAFFAGLAVSPHCGAMCAPLTCALGPWRASQERRLAFTTAYHLSRTTAYATAGAAAGLLGGRFGRSLETPLMTYLPWAMVGFLVLLATGFDQGLPMPGFVRRAQAGLMRRSQSMPPTWVGVWLGGLTPLLPCGPLHALLGLALLSGAALRGAEIGLGFALGTMPLLWATQMGYHRLSLRLGQAKAQHVRRALAGLVALGLAAKLLWFTPSTGVCL